MRLPSLGRLTLPTTGLLVAVLTLGAMSAPASADGTDPDPTSEQTAEQTAGQTPPVPTTDPAAEATEALEQVQSILTDPPASSDTDGRDLTLALRDLRLHQDDLTARQRATAKRLAPSRPLPDSAPHQDFDDKTGKAIVRVHWAAGDSAVTQDWRNTVGRVVTNVLGKYKAAGYRAPESDGTRGGGSGLLDIYLVDFDQPGLYGFCDAAVQPPSSGPYDTSAYCAFNHDFSEFPALSREDNLKVTAAHELFHATQFAYDYREDAWFMEATAAWAEDEVYDSINDNRQYLPLSPLAQPGQSLDEFSGDLRHYGRWIFFRYLSERFPQAQAGLPVIVRRIWQRADSSRGPSHDNYSIQAVRREIASRGTDLRRIYAQFGAANRHPRRAYEEGAFYRAAPAARRWNLTPKRHDTRWQIAKVDHLATQTVQVKPSRAMKRWRLRVAVNLPSKKYDTAALVTTYATSGRLKSRFVRVSKAGNGRATVTFDARKISRVDVTLSNAGTHYRQCWLHPDRSVVFSCSGLPADNNRRLRYRITAVR